MSEIGVPPVSVSCGHRGYGPGWVGVGSSAWGKEEYGARFLSRVSVWTVCFRLLSLVGVRLGRGKTWGVLSSKGYSRSSSVNLHRGMDPRTDP